MKPILSVLEEKPPIFKLWCNSCPLKPHFEAIGIPASPCIEGISTAMNGMIPAKSCLWSGKVERIPDKRPRFPEPEPGEDKPTVLVIECRYGEKN